MKSKFLSKDSLTTAQIETLKKLDALSTEQLHSIRDWFNGLEVDSLRLGGPRTNAYVASRNNLAAKIQIEPRLLSDIESLLRIITRYVEFHEDKVADVAEDLVSGGFIGSQSMEKVEELITSVLVKGTEFSKQRRRTAVEHGEIPALSSISYSANLRLVSKDDFYPDEMHIEDYNPVAEQLIPVAILEFVSYDGYRTHSYPFVVNFAELEDLIVVLQACQKQLRLLEAVSRKLDLSS